MKNTQQRVAALLGVDQATVSRWWNVRSNMQLHKGSDTPDARVKIAAEANAERSKAQKGIPKAEAKERGGPKWTRTFKHPERIAKAAAAALFTPIPPIANLLTPGLYLGRRR